MLVYDLGGGTFDVSIVQAQDGVVEVLASHGDTQLGGDDFDELLLKHVVRPASRREHGIDLRAQPSSPRPALLRAVEEAKRQLSYHPFARIEEEFIAEKDGQALHLNLEISRERVRGADPPAARPDDGLRAAGPRRRQADRPRRSTRSCWSAAARGRR